MAAMVERMRIGWIGLGAIGTPMARRALDAGHALTAYARGSGLDTVMAAGGATASDYRAVAADRDIVVLCLFDDAQVRSVLFDHGALAAMTPGSILAIHTTGSPALARSVQQAAPAGVIVLDAAFSGTPAQAGAGTLTLIVGGPSEALDRARPLFDAYAGQIHHVGGLGQGQIVKLLNNLLFAANLHNAAEVLRLAGHQGIAASLCANIFQGCSAASTASALFKGDAPVDAVMESALPFLVKDVATATATLRELGIDAAPLSATIAYFERQPSGR